MKERIYTLIIGVFALTLVYSSSIAQSLEGVHSADKDVIAVIVETSGAVNTINDAIDSPSQSVEDWEVNGAAPVEVGRYTYVTDQVRSSGGGHYITLKHHMYIKLDGNLENGTTYVITSPNGSTIDFEFHDEVTFCEAIKVNQVGYFGNSQKRFAIMGIFLGNMGARQLSPVPPFKVLDERNSAVHTGNLQYFGLFDDSGEHVYQMDISALPDGGPYRISIPGYGVSYPFGVGSEYIDQSSYVHLRGMYHQRCGIALEEPYTSYTRGVCHQIVEVTDANPPGMIDQSLRGPARPIVGGYHDAGDFDRRPSHTVVPAWMLMLYEAYPDGFTDYQFNLPESGNGVPDWLDECLWGLKIWEELQEPSGAIRAGTETHLHPSFEQYNAETDPYLYKTYGVDGHTTASGAGLFAHASRLVRPFNPVRADELLDAAVAAWEYLMENSMPTAHDAQMMYAALQLYLATEDQEYHDHFKSYASESFNYNPGYVNLNQIRSGQLLEPYFFSYLITDLDADQSIKDKFIGYLNNRANNATIEVNNSPYPIGTSGVLAWGTATNQGRYAMPLILLYRLYENQEHLDVVSQLADYTLGLNPLGRSYVTGLGVNQPQSICHADSYHIKQNNPEMGNVPGLVVFGPVQSPNSAAHEVNVHGRVYPEFTSLPRQRRYSDGWTFIGATEFTTWETMASNACMYGFLHSVTASSTSIGNPPVAPTNLDAASVMSTRVSISWADNSDNETGFKIERKTTDEESFNEIARVESNVSTFTDDELQPSHDYVFRVRAYNSIGNSGYSNALEVTTLPVPAVPDAPSGLSAASVENIQIEVSWEDNSNNEDGFIVERKPDGGTYAQVGTVSENITIFMNTDLAPSTTYHFRVKAFNEGGESGNSNEIFASTGQPSVYSSIDIGTSTQGNTSHDETEVTVQGSGARLWSDDDGFRYVYQEVQSGDVEFVARLVSTSASRPGELSGIMIRNSTDEGASYQGIFVNGNMLERSQYRSGQWTSAEYTGDEPVTLPIWLKVEKSSANNIMRTSTSTDGVNWTQRGQQWLGVNINNPFTVGLAVCSSLEGELSTATFDNVQWPQGLPDVKFNVFTNAPNGSITLFPYGGQYEPGTSVTLFAAPSDDRFVFESWGGDLTGDDNPATITVDMDKSVVANFSTNPAYRLTANAANGTINLNPDGGIYTEGVAVTLTLSVDRGYSFDGWQGDLSGVENPTTIVMDGNKNVWVKFTSSVIYSVNTSATNGNISIYPLGGEYEAGTEITIRATPYSNDYQFVSWDGDLSGSENPITLTLDSDLTVSTVFADAPLFALEANAINGEVTVYPDAEGYRPGTMVVATASGNTNYTFDGWSGDISGSMNPILFQVNNDMTISAVYSVIPVFTLTTNATNGTVGLSPQGGEYSSGTLVRAEAFPDEGYIFESWSGDYEGTLNPVSIRMDEDKSITAIFIQATSSAALNQQSNALMQNYPNPFSDFTSIPYQLQTDGDVTIQILDVIGRTIWSSKLNNQTSGSHSIHWDASDLNGIKVQKGIYFYQIRISTQLGVYTDVRRMIVQ